MIIIKKWLNFIKFIYKMRILNFYKTIRSLEAAVSSRRTKCVNLSFARIVKSRSPQAKLEVVSIHRAYARVAIVKRE